MPYVIGSNKGTTVKSTLLKENGFNVLPIRYSTVPKNTARLRFSLNANLKFKQLQPIKNIILQHEETMVK